MKEKIKILVTAGGAPQAATLIRHLQNNGEREVSIVAVDMNEEVIGRFLADAFYTIPAAGSLGYRERIVEIVRKEKPDAFLNACGADVPCIASYAKELEALGTRVLVSDPVALETANNKFKLYSVLEKTEGVSVPEFKSPSTLDEFVAMAYEMGYPERDLCFKPHIAKGSRGFRILSEKFDRRDLLLNHKPTARYMNLAEFQSIFQNTSDDFPKLLLMEHLTGEECDLMTIAYNGEALLTTVKSRESHRWGIIDRGELISRPDIEQAAGNIIRRIPLQFNISIQFIGGKVLEINPRTSTFIFADNLNEPWIAVKLALGLITPDEVKAYQDMIPYGRRMVRFMDQVFFDQAGKWTY
jgi:carbamoyl-phosphate synthase large subunit